MPRLKDILELQDFELWASYQEQESRGLKKDAKKSLDLFINILKENSGEQLDSIVLSLCEQREYSDLNIKHNLFERIIYPNLMKNAKCNLPDYYRQLATFEQYFHSSNKLAATALSELQLTENHVSAIELLERELQNNKNTKAAQRLANKLGWHLDYALHELPTGLIYESTDIEEICQEIEELIKVYGIELELWKSRLNYVRTTLSEWENFNKERHDKDFFEYLKDIKTKESSIILNWGTPLFDYQQV